VVEVAVLVVAEPSKVVKETLEERLVIFPGVGDEDLGTAGSLRACD
jgi:hypothetical protein